jgi:beta-N-acetylhexosaminidase
MMAARVFITGLAGLQVSASERAFLREAQPWGLIIFKRNVSEPAQVQALVRSFRDILGWEAPVLVDQEGGRVQRLGPPHWPVYPPGVGTASFMTVSQHPASQRHGSPVI